MLRKNPHQKKANYTSPVPSLSTLDVSVGNDHAMKDKVTDAGTFGRKSFLHFLGFFALLILGLIVNLEVSTKSSVKQEHSDRNFDVNDKSQWALTDDNQNRNNGFSKLMSVTKPYVVTVPSSSEIRVLESNIEHGALNEHNFSRSGPNALDKPALLKGWDSKGFKELQNMWSRDNFLVRYGDFPQYLKSDDVQPLKDANGEYCKVSTSDLIYLLETLRDQKQVTTGPKDKGTKDVLFFSNDAYNVNFFEAAKRHYFQFLPRDRILEQSGFFSVFSAMTKGNSHPFHKHGEAWIGQVHGRKLWWFLPPGTKPIPEKVNACEYLTGNAPLPEGIFTSLQEPGDFIWLPKNWYHATCALDDWSIGVGMQALPIIRQNFPKLSSSIAISTLRDTEPFVTKMRSCGILQLENKDSSAEYHWVDGDLNEYYNKLEKEIRRNPNDIGSIAVHRYLGDKKSTMTHYDLIYKSIKANVGSKGNALRILDAGCGLGAGLLWFEQKEPSWKMTGYTISDVQHKFITEKIPTHKFDAKLQSYNNIDGGTSFDVIYSIEAFIHSPDYKQTLQTWFQHLADGGIVAIIDDFLSSNIYRDEYEVDIFRKAWLAQAVITPSEFVETALSLGFNVVEDRDLVSQFQIVKNNYHNRLPDLKDRRKHQGWLGGAARQRLTVQGKLTYRMIILQKKGIDDVVKPAKEVIVTSKKENTCASVPMIGDGEKVFSTKIESHLMTGRGVNGGDNQGCLSGWYCCGKGPEHFQKLKDNRTQRTSFLKLPQEVFGNYLDSFAHHLNTFYESVPEGTSGKFLDIGGAGSTASGMLQVSSKFKHFSGPFDYWILDSDQAAGKLDNAIVCDMANCPAANNCEFDITFSHTVLEHSPYPWRVFDEIARITKRGGLTLHLVPFSYQYHATPDDNFRFSHKALQTLMEDRNFKVLDVGYDICYKQESKANEIDEHFDEIWLTYIVAQKIE